MVNYFNPLAMYHAGHSKVPGTVSHYGGGGTGAWYGGWQGSGQQYDESSGAAAWHHAQLGAAEWSTPEYPGTTIQEVPLSFPKREPAEPALPSPPAASDLSSPGASSPSACARPSIPRSPYEWMKKPNYQSQPNPGKTRTKDKYRVVYSDHQRLELEKEFHYSRYITIRRKAELAANLGLSERQVKIWFQNRRAKERKQVKKREEVALKDKVEPRHATSLQHIHHATVLHHQQMMSGMIQHHHHHPGFHQNVGMGGMAGVGDQGMPGMPTGPPPVPLL